jgi:hypothetical protein
MTATKGPTLTDAKGMGGVIAQDGFDYQVWDALARIPAWILSPVFEGFIIEGLEDVEARFFAPQAPALRLLDRFQAKSGVLSRAELIVVFSSFQTFEATHPQVTRLQTLVTPQLPPALAWIGRDPGRVRRARPFYGPFASVQAASDDKLRQDLIGEFGEDLGGFFADMIEIDLQPVMDRARAEITFGAALQAAFPEVDVGPRASKTAFGALNDLAAQSRGVMLTRARLIGVLQTALGADLGLEVRLRLHLRSDRNEPGEDALEIDAGAFSKTDGTCPPPEAWVSDLLAPMERAAVWARQGGRQRLLLTGSYRLSTAFVAGWSFRSANGFELDIATRAGVWSTDSHATAASGPGWTIAEPAALANGRLVVTVGVLRDPSADVQQALGLAADGLLTATLPAALVDGAAVQASVGQIKTAVSLAAARLRPKQIDLYYAGPAGFAVALGHRWNGMVPTQLFEFLPAQRRYVPTAWLA